MLIFNSWYTASNSSIYLAGEDGSGLRCLTSRYTLRRYQRLRLSPDRSRLSFLAVPPDQETGKFFVLELDAGRLMVDKQEPNPFDMRWLSNDRLLCSRKGKIWTAS